MNTRALTKSAAIAAIYVILTVAPGFSWGPIQFRLSEVMTLLVVYNPAYLPALTMGCILSNLFSPLGFVDLLFGTLHTFLALYAMTKVKNIWIASLFPGLFSFIIGLEIVLFLSEAPSILEFFLVTGQIMISEIIIVSIIGVPIFKILEKYPSFKKIILDL